MPRHLRLRPVSSGPANPGPHHTTTGSRPSQRSLDKDLVALGEQWCSWRSIVHWTTLQARMAQVSRPVPHIRSTAGQSHDRTMDRPRAAATCLAMPLAVFSMVEAPVSEPPVTAWIAPWGKKEATMSSKSAVGRPEHIQLLGSGLFIARPSPRVLKAHPCHRHFKNLFDLNCNFLLPNAID